MGFESVAGQSGARDAEEYETVVRTQGPSSTNELIASDLDELYAELDATPAVIVSQERETKREEGSFNVSGLLKPITPSPSFSAPPDPSPPPPRPSLTGHVDWNWPPAFSLRNRAPQSGHLAGTGEEALDNSDEDDEEAEEVKRPAALGSSDLNVLLPGASVLQAPKQALGSSNEASLDAHTPDKALHALTETTSAGMESTHSRVLPILIISQKWLI